MTIQIYVEGDAELVRQQIQTLFATPTTPAALASVDALFSLPAQIGAELQGGIYAGPYVEDGQVHHLISAREDLGSQEWEVAGQHAKEYKGGGFSDWRLPTKNEGMACLAAVAGLFEKSYYWTSTPSGSGTAWAVSFEGGDVLFWYRDREFRVRPVRRFTY